MGHLHNKAGWLSDASEYEWETASSGEIFEGNSCCTRAVSSNPRPRDRGGGGRCSGTAAANAQKINVEWLLTSGE
jgi:hypothetical protein